MFRRGTRPRGLIARVVLALLLVLPADVGAEELLVAAAASLSDVLTEIGRGYEARTNTRVVFTFAATSTLTRQIRAGAPIDVFFSADAEHMKELERAGLVARDTRLDLLSNVLVIVVPVASATSVRRPADLTTLGRVALADPEAVPAGVYARTYLRSLGLWDAVRERVVPTVDVRAALAAVAGGDVDAAIVYRTDAAVSPRVRVAVEVPRDGGPHIVYTLAPLVGAKPAAHDLVRHLASPEARAVYARHGFVVMGGK